MKSFAFVTTSNMCDCVEAISERYRRICTKFCVMTDLQQRTNRLNFGSDPNPGIGGGAYLPGRAIARPLFGPNGQTILLALPLLLLRNKNGNVSATRFASALSFALRKMVQICYRQMHFTTLKCVNMRSWPELRPGPRWGSLPDSRLLAGFKGAASRRRGRERRGVDGGKDGI